MCIVCASRPSADLLSGYDQHQTSVAGKGFGSGSGAPYTFDQIAGYLTDGYWNYVGESRQLFDFTFDPSRTLTYNTSFLSSGAKQIAEQAFEVWASVTGINFVQIGTAPEQRTEFSDIAGSTLTNFTITNNAKVAGTISSGTDEDYYRVTLEAGQNYIFGISGGSLDSIITLYDAQGNIIVQQDNADDAAAGEYLTYTAAPNSTGTYYIGASGFDGSTGAYDLITATATADINFGDIDETGAYEQSDISGNTIERAYINIHDNWDALNLNGYMLQTYIHEIGHALGLGHGGPYNFTAEFNVDALYDNDSWSASVMSYFDQDQNPFDPNDFAYLATVMPADIIAIQNLYGSTSTSHQIGNTVWGPGGNVGGNLQSMLNMWAGITPTNAFIYAGNPFAFTIYDDGGIDTLNAAAFSMAQTLNLNELSYSNIGGLIGNVAIARDVIIENATGGGGNDSITGNTTGNTLSGGAGADLLDGGLANDILIGGLGADELIGGAGTADRAQYSDATAGVRADLLDSATNTGFATGDTFSGVENLFGSSFGDTLFGDAGANQIWGDGGNDAFLDGRSGNDQIYGGIGIDSLYGGEGADILDGGLGADRLQGGDGADRDRASYANADAGVRADLQVAAFNTGEAAGDTYFGIEELAGSGLGDTLLGDAAGNFLSGGGGNDAWIDGRLGNDTLNGDDGNDVLIGGQGADALFGGAGTGDRAQYTDASGGLRADLQVSSFNTGFAAGDTYLSVEDLYGSFHGDTLLGDGGNNRIWGDAGSDAWLDGRVGSDTLYGGAGNDVLIGGQGGDVLDGGDGTRDRAQYTDAAGVDADLMAITGRLGFAAGDSYIGIEDIYGSFHADSLYGDVGGNILWGASGNDLLNGRMGNDTLIGGSGNDTITGGGGIDVFIFESAASGTNLDTITDYLEFQDIIHLENAIFTALTTAGALASEAFTTGIGATTTAHRIIYNSANGQVLYDADGNGGNAAVNFAVLTAGLSMTAAEFLII